MEEGRWVTIGGRRVYIKTNQSPMDAYIRQKGGTTTSKEDEEFNNNFYMQDGDFYDEWRKAQPNKEWNSSYDWGEEKKIDVYDRKTNKQVGFLKYKEVKDFTKTSMKDKMNVVIIHVDEQYRRKGIATQMYKELQRRTGDEDIYFGEMSKDGKKLVDKIGKITKKENGHYWGRINL